MSRPLDRLFGLKALRFADLIGRQGREAYDVLGVDMDAKLNSMVISLMELGPSTSTELAARTGLSRQLVESRIRKLEQGGYVQSALDPEDARRRVYELTSTHADTLAQVQAIMSDFESVYTALWDEIGVDLSQALSKAESALHRQTLTDRLLEHHPGYAKSIKETA